MEFDQQKVIESFISEPFKEATFWWILFQEFLKVHTGEFFHS